MKRTVNWIGLVKPPGVVKAAELFDREDKHLTTGLNVYRYQVLAGKVPPPKGKAAQ